MLCNATYSPGRLPKLLYKNHLGFYVYRPRPLISRLNPSKALRETQVGIQRDVYQSVTDSVVALIEKGVEPWRQPWKNVAGVAAESVLPVNAATGRGYRGINVPILWGAAQAFGYRHNAWLTYRQAADLGGHVRKGEHGQPVIFWKFLDKAPRGGEAEGDEDAHGRRIAFAREYYVFNVAQCDGLPETGEAEVAERLQPGEVIQFAQRVGAQLRFGGNRAFYAPDPDFIQLPLREQFVDEAHYNSTALHELTHWTGHKARLDRQFGKRFGDNAYAFEELVAELGSAFLCASTGIENAPVTHHASYVENWLQVLKGDKRAIFTAASQAQKAATYCLDRGAQPVEVAA